MIKRDKEGKIIKGTGGRQKGVKNHKTRDWNEMRDYIKNKLVPKYVEKVQDLMDSDDIDKEMAGMEKMLNILEYFAPKLARTESKVVSDNTTKITGIINVLDPEKDGSKPK